MMPDVDRNECEETPYVTYDFSRIDRYNSKKL